MSIGVFQLDITTNLSSSSDSHSNDHNTNRKNSRTDEGNWQVNIGIEFFLVELIILIGSQFHWMKTLSISNHEEWKKDELKMKCQPENIAIRILLQVSNEWKEWALWTFSKRFISCSFLFIGTKTSSSKRSNLVDTNPESSISGSNSNSMISKTPTSVQTLAGDAPKDDSLDELEKTSNCLTIRPGRIYE